MTCPVCGKRPAACECSREALYGYVGQGTTPKERDRRRRIRGYWFYVTGRYQKKTTRETQCT